MEELPREYRWEPDLALRGGERGLDFLEPLLNQAANFLNPGGSLIVESGSASPAVEQRWPEVEFTWLGTAHDEMVLFLLTSEQLQGFNQ